MAKAKTKAKRVSPRGSRASDGGSVRPPSRLVDAHEANPLGGATKDDLAAVAKEALGTDPDLEASETEIAIESLARIIAARMAHTDWPNDPKRLAVFIVSDRARELAGSLNATLEPILDNGSKAFAGKLWLASPSLASGYFASFESSEPSGMFKEVDAKGLGSRPALVFDPSATDPEIRYYPIGLSTADQVQRFSIANEVFTLGGLDKVMQRFYENNIITPDAAPSELNLWSNSRKYFPREHAEAFLQGMLRMALGMVFRNCRVAFEVRGTEGRCDLLITSRSQAQAGAWISHAAMELKVLRSFTSGGKSVSGPARTKAVRDGFLQVVAYKHENAAQDGMLCCFDMRSPKHCDGQAIFKPIAKEATRKKIELRQYRIFASSGELRSMKYGTESASA